MSHIQPRSPKPCKTQNCKKITKEEAKKILQECISHNLIQIGDNIQENVNWICNCCGCCCEAILAYKKLGYAPNLTSNFLCKNNHVKCTGCTLCKKICPVDAIEIQTDNNNKKKAIINENRCIGCGLCVKKCPAKSLKLERTKTPQTVPKDLFERQISMAIDTGTIQNYLFDNQQLLSHKFLRAFLSTLINLPISKQILANQQLKSTFLNKLTNTKYYEPFQKLCNNNQKTNYTHTEFK